MPTTPIETERLTLLPATAALLRLELEDRAAFGRALECDLPPGWPPGEYDADAARFFLGMLEAEPERFDGWLGYYGTTRPGPGVPRELVAAAGYFGPPDAGGTVEIGFSVVETRRGAGLATEITEALCEHAFAAGARRVVARSNTDNSASHRVLLRTGFHEVASDDPALKRFERPR